MCASRTSTDRQPRRATDSRRRAGEARRRNLSAKDQEIVIHCRTGGRSQKAALILKKAGFTKVKNLAGGITAWADKIDPTMPKY